MGASWLEVAFRTIAGSNTVVHGLMGGIIITLMNLLGACLVLVWRKPSQKFLDSALGFAAGVMIAASFTSLIIPAIDRGGVLPVLIGIALGALALDLADMLLPHLHTVSGREGPDSRLKAVWLLIIAITLHNMPEGLAVGVGFGAENLPQALGLMLAIGFQNIPEGLAVSVSALNANMGRGFYAMLTGARAGLVEIPLALLGVVAVQQMQGLLPYAMGFAAGAMLYVVSDEILPETHRIGHERMATFGTMLGLIVMLYLDVTLG